MDLIKLIRDKSEFFNETTSYQGLQAVITHIEVAEKHLDKGKSGDDYFFTDVIYRTNQAFEGALKEAYRIFTGENPDKTNPFQIETYLDKEKVLKDRVLNLFSNYRTEWRNKSTHDYTLYFSDQEAFLAIVNICAFFNILLDQMIESYGIKEGKEEAVKNPTSTLKKEKLLNVLKKLLFKFSELTPPKARGVATPVLVEREIFGMLFSYLKESQTAFEIFPEALIAPDEDKIKYRADFLVNQENEKIIIELKKPGASIERIITAGVEQVFKYLVVSQCESGILYIPPVTNSQIMECDEIKQNIGSKMYTVLVISPSAST